MVSNIWIFNGSGSQFASAVFTDLESAKEWIAKHKLSGILTLYPVNTSVYDWAIQNHHITPKEPRQFLPEFIQKFTSAYQEHYHFEDGQME